MNAINFRKGSSSSKSLADTLATNDTVEVLLGICEGPIKGPVDGPKSFYADDTALVNANGQPNLSNFSLDFWPGAATGHDVSLLLGGFGAPFSIGQSLTQNLPLVRTGSQTGITAADFRIVLAQVFKQDSKGTHVSTVQLKFEYKRVNEPAWKPCFSGSSTNNPGLQPGSSADQTPAGLEAQWAYNKINNVLNSFMGDKKVVATTGAPTTTPTSQAIAVDPTAGNVYHWDTGSSTWSLAQTTVAVNARYATFDDDGVSRRIYNSTNELTPTDARRGDIWHRGVGNYVIWNGTAWVLPAQYQDYNATPQFLSNGVWSFTGKISSATPINIRVFLEESDQATEYRVTKLTTDSTTEVFSEVVWESVNEIRQKSWHFESLAMLRIIGEASEQFTALPTWNGIYEGRIVKVPTNYNPITRVYTGVWDGSYKLEYTNNTAWVFQDFVENDLYGLSSLYPHTCNKWSIYAWAQWNDQMVPKADGTLQPRWTFNLPLVDPMGAEEMARYIAGSAAATYIDDGNGMVDVLVDMDAPSVALFTAQNVGDDGFDYTYTERLTCHNYLSVAFINPNLNWDKDHRIVKSDDDIAQFGRIETDFIAVGCIDVDEALRRGRRRLISGITEREGVSFATNRKGRYLRIWDKILIADPYQGRGVGGRIRSQMNARTVSLRDPLNLEAGFIYYITFDVVDGTTGPFKTLRRRIVTAHGAANYELEVDEDLPTLPTMAAFTLECEGLLGLPKPYRIMNIEPLDAENVKIMAMELNVNKYAYIDQAVDLGTVDYSAFSNTIVAPATNPDVSVSVRQMGSLVTRILTLSWTGSTDPFVRNYKIYHSFNESVATVSETRNTSIELDGSSIGEHAFVIVAINMKGRESAPVEFRYNVLGTNRPVPEVANLRLVGGVTPVTFDALDATFSFDPVSSPNLKGYELQVLNSSTNVTIRTIDLGLATTYTYDFGSNKADGLRRTFKISVRAYDQDGNYSPPVSLTASNPPPAAPAINVKAAVRGFNVTLAPSTERDIAGAKVWVGATAGFNPVETPHAIEGAQNSFFVPYEETGTRFIRAAFYDGFSSVTAGLNISSEVTEQILALDLDSIGGVPVTTLINNMQTSLQTSANAILSAQLLQQYIDAKLYDGNGRDVQYISLKAEERANDVFTSMNLQGYKHPNGSAWIMDLTKLMVTPTQSLAIKFDSIESTVGLHTASISVLKEASEGINAKWRLAITNGNQIAGIEAGVNQEYSYLDFVGSRVRFVDPSDPNNIKSFLEFAGGDMFINADVRIRGSLIVLGTVTTGSLEPNAVSEFVSTAVGPVTNISVEKTIATLVINPKGGRVRLDWRIGIENGNSETSARVKLYRNGVNISGSLGTKLFNSYTTAYVDFFVDLAGYATPVTYAITAQTLSGQNIGDTGGTGENRNVQGAVFSAEVKKR